MAVAWDYHFGFVGDPLMWLQANSEDLLRTVIGRSASCRRKRRAQKMPLLKETLHGKDKMVAVAPAAWEIFS